MKQKDFCLLFSLESRKQGHLLRIKQAWSKELMKIIRVWEKHYHTCQRKVTREGTKKFSAVLEAQLGWWTLNFCNGYSWNCHMVF